MREDQTLIADAFHHGRSFSTWQDKPIAADVLTALYELMKWGPTSANCCPLQIVFAQSEDAKAKLVECVAAGNKEKVRTFVGAVTLSKWFAITQSSVTCGNLS